MSLIPKIFSSADAGAPVLTGQAGSLAALLDAVLVQGYGSEASFKPGLGWSLEHQSVHKRAYRNDPLEGSGLLVRLDDSGAIGNARHAWVRGYESMTDVDSGFNPFPTPSQSINGGMLPKSVTLNSVQRPWWIIGNCRCLYLFVAVDSGAFAPYFLGDLTVRNAVDRFAFAIGAAWLGSWNGSVFDRLSELFVAVQGHSGSGTSLSGGAAFGFVARDVQSVPGAAVIGLSNSDTIGSIAGRVGFPYPDPAFGGLILSTLSVRLPSSAPKLRGFLPGVFAPLHSLPFSDLELVEEVTFLGGASLIAKSFRAGNWGQTTSSDGQVLFRYTDEW